MSDVASEVVGVQRPGRDELLEVDLEDVELVRADLGCPPVAHVVEQRTAGGHRVAAAGRHPDATAAAVARIIGLPLDAH
jgi:hypothetical protein